MNRREAIDGIVRAEFTDCLSGLQTCPGDGKCGRVATHAPVADGQGPAARRGHPLFDAIAGALHGRHQVEANLTLLIGIVAMEPLHGIDAASSTPATFVVVEHPAPDVVDPDGHWGLACSSVELSEELAAELDGILRGGETIFVVGHLVGSGSLRATIAGPAYLLYRDFGAAVEETWRGRAR